jgi:hypothetical protein
MQLIADMALFGLVGVMVTLLCVGVAKSARLAGSDPSAASRLALATAIAIALWLTLSSVLALFGVLSAWTSPPPRMPLLLLCAFIALIAVGRSATTTRLIAAAPSHWAIAAQTFRIGVELAIFALYVDGRAPRQITFEGRNFDILVGLSAPLIAWLVARGRLGPKGVLVWNIAGLAVLLNTMVTVASSMPGPTHLDWPGAPFAAAASWPVVWLPAFLAPLAVFLHITSLRQAIGGLRAHGSQRQ